MNALKKQWRAIQNAHDNLMKRMENDDDQYWKDHNKLQIAIGKFAREENFGDLTKKDILQLCGLIYKYNAVTFHAFLMKCQTQFELSS